MRVPVPALFFGATAAVLATLAVAAGSEEGLRGPDAFSGVADETTRSAALFTEMGKVLQHPRCLNCHPSGDTPLQGDAMTPHTPPVQRGEDGLGVAGMRCFTCHGAENVAFLGRPGSIPGHESWHLAPRSMAWVGRSLAEICAQIKDPARNGERSLEEIHAHLAEDGLVGWGWHPGDGRTPAPGTQERLGQLTRAWIDSGAHCPAE